MLSLSVGSELLKSDVSSSVSGEEDIGLSVIGLFSSWLLLVIGSVGISVFGLSAADFPSRLTRSGLSDSAGVSMIL